MLCLPLVFASTSSLAVTSSPNGANWTEDTHFAIGVGCNGEVSALAHAPDGRVVVGGSFSQCGQAPARNIAVFDPQNESWSALGAAGSNGVDARVRALAFHAGELFVGGEFTAVADAAGERPARGFARWTGTAWSAPDLSRFNVQWINALQSTAQGLYVGGQLSEQPTPGLYVSGVFRWDGNGLARFHAATSTSVGEVSALAEFNGELIVAGQLGFPVQGHSGSAPPQLARWTGSAWAVLGQQGAGGVDGTVTALTTHAGALFVGGRFSAVDTTDMMPGGAGVDARNIARWNGSAWSPLGSGTDGRVLALSSTPNGLLVGGLFSQAGAQSQRGLARWDGSDWVAAPDLGADPQTRVLALAASASEIIVGGRFGWRQSGGQVPTLLNHVARLADQAWQPLGALSAGGANDPVIALAVHQGELFAGGIFTSIGGVAANRLARHDGLGWQALGDEQGNGVDGPVFALLSRPDGLYLGGAFTRTRPGGADQTSVRGLARWNGSRIEALGPDVGVGLSSGDAGVVYRLHEDDGALLVAGLFSQTEADGSVAPSSGLARYTGGLWSEVTAGGEPVGSTVRALVQAPEGLTVGGQIFESAFDPDLDEWVTTAAGVVRATATGWEALASPGGYGLGPASSSQFNLFPEVFALQRFNGELFAGGRFTLADAGSSNEVAVNNIARWTGTRWLPVGGPGQGPEGTVNALIVLGDQLAVLGDFRRVRTGPASVLPARGIVLYGPGGWSAPREFSIGASALADQASVLLPWNNGVLIAGRFGQQGARPASHLVWTPAPLFSSGFEAGPNPD
jgi:hypothetical protein